MDKLFQTFQSLLIFITLLLTSKVHEINFYLDCVIYIVLFSLPFIVTIIISQNNIL